MSLENAPFLGLGREMTIELERLNSFIKNVSLIAPDRSRAHSYKDGGVTFALWWNKDFSAVNVQVADDFKNGNQNRKLGVQGGRKITYYINGKLSPVGIDQEQAAFLTRLFNHAEKLAEKKGVIEILKAEGTARSFEVSKLFMTPKEETILKEYRERFAILSNSEKEKLRDKVYEVALDQAYTCGTNLDFIKTSSTQKIIYQLSQELFGPYKENLIMSLGQSPAWFSAMAQIDQPNPERFTFVAFSGDWFGLFDKQSHKELLFDYKGRSIERKEDECRYITYIDKSLRLELIETHLPTAEQTKNYRSYLLRIGCSPERIIAQKVPVVIVDYVQRAGGLKSFLEFLFTWAKEERVDLELLKKKLVLQCMYDKGVGLLGDEANAKSYIQENLGQYSASPVMIFSIVQDEYTPEAEAIRDIFSKAHNAVSEQRRLIKRFPPREWTAENCKKSSFAEYKGQINEYIFPIYANFIHTVKRIHT